MGKDNYDPENYWDDRAKTGAKNIYQAVCIKNASDIENKAVEIIQLKSLSRNLAPYDLTGKKVLEFGCGIGRLAPWFMKRGLKYTGVDISNNMLSVAKEQIKDGEFHKLDNHMLPFPKDTFDLTCSITVINHNRYEHQGRIIDELLRVTKPGGLILLLEGLDRGNSAFNLFPNTLDQWVSMVVKNGCAKLLDKQLIHLWITRSLYRKIYKIFKGNSYNEEVFKKTILNKIMVRIGIRIDPLLTIFITEKYAIAATMLFRKLDKSPGHQHEA